MKSQIKKKNQIIRELKDNKVYLEANLVMRTMLWDREVTMLREKLEEYKNKLVKQARYVRNYSNAEESFKAVPLRFILEDYEHGMEAAHNIKEKNT